jgi:hypothetical protein
MMMIMMFMFVCPYFCVGYDGYGYPRARCLWDIWWYMVKWSNIKGWIIYYPHGPGWSWIHLHRDL